VLPVGTAAGGDQALDRVCRRLGVGALARLERIAAVDVLAPAEERRRAPHGALAGAADGCERLDDGGGVVDPADPAAREVEAAVRVLPPLQRRRGTPDGAIAGAGAGRAQRQDTERGQVHEPIEGPVAILAASEAGREVARRRAPDRTARGG